MRRLIGLFALVASFSLLAAAGAGCGSDHPPGPPCPQQCGANKPFCGPNGECVECVYNTDCKSGQICNKNFECH